jgi:hypothetical protein
MTTSLVRLFAVISGAQVQRAQAWREHRPGGFGGLPNRGV